MNKSISRKRGDNNFRKQDIPESSILKSLLYSIIRYALIIAILSFVLFVVSTRVPIVRYFFEEDAPDIKIVDIPKGLGVNPGKLKLEVSDPHSGIELVRARVEQSRINKVLIEESPPLNTKTFLKSIQIDAQALGLRKGMARITVEAYDRSLKSNGSKSFIDLPVRFDAPKIEILSSQHNGEKSGMEFVVYRLKAGEVAETGIRIGPYSFKGFPASSFDPDIAGISDLYVALYAIPNKVDTRKDVPTSFALNEVGNISLQNFYYRIRERKKRSWEYRTDNLLASQESMQNVISIKLSEIPPVSTRLWLTHIPKPVGKETSPRIGDDIRIINNSGREQTFQNLLITMRTSKNQEIRTTAPGVLILSGWINQNGEWLENKTPGSGPLSGVVAIDHGMGLVSVFCGLDDINNLTGAKFSENAIIGTSGNLTLINEPGYYYGLFFQGEAIRPEEWWDQTWVREHITRKVQDIKIRYNIGGASLAANEGSLVPSAEEPPTREIIRSLDDLRNQEQSVDKVD
ncbi:MAG TPA: hypothetical protein PKA63_09205 [Oligoflexia bacterium]|nr:hypothetical protein [Oligoflexia bacterium]HMP48830.1 hypothetical protein [Oligoflexia bacterium]